MTTNVGTSDEPMGVIARIGQNAYEASVVLNRLDRCTCAIADVTAIGDDGRRSLIIRDPLCRAHSVESASNPEISCAHCGNSTTVGEASWETRSGTAGWCCAPCRRAMVIDTLRVPPRWVTGLTNI